MAICQLFLISFRSIADETFKVAYCVINVVPYFFDILLIISACLSDLLTNDFRLFFQSVLDLFDLALLDV
jgi:hypothetical protein